MLSDFDSVVTFSRGIRQHKALNHFLGDRLCTAANNTSPNACVIGWGNKENTKKARDFAKENHYPYFNIEDGFIRSVGLGVKKAPPFSVVIDDLGMYYDATKPSRLETILQEYDFDSDEELITQADQAIRLLQRFKISKYNINGVAPEEEIERSNKKKILVIAQTAGDMSLKYGCCNQFTTIDIINAAIKENPEADIYVKIHPDVISGKKESDIKIAHIPSSCRLLTLDMNPFSLLEHMDKVYTKTSQMGFEALLLDKECVCFGLPFYSGWGLTDDRVECPRRQRELTVKKIFAAAYILYAHYFNPYLGKNSDIIDTLYTIKRYKDIEEVNGASLLFHGFPPWKQLYHRYFFKSNQRNRMMFCSSTKKIKANESQSNARLLIWSKKENQELQEYLQTTSLPIYRVEDGFIRSVSLGSDLTMPYSLVVDSRGLYIDPSQESDLEHIYNNYAFQAHTRLLTRARKVANDIVNAKLSKYNYAPHGNMEIDRDQYDKVILIPGQVADDASILLGGYGMDNLTLMQLVRERNPEAYLIYKPHPDVVVGNRKGDLPNDLVLQSCNAIITDISIDSCITMADEIHTITSLCGFDGIIRDKKVYTYGMPFYAGWGLTEDYHTCERRKRVLSKDELVAGALLLYPRYVHPTTKELCEIERVLEAIIEERQLFERSALYRRRKQLRNGAIAISRRLFDRVRKADA